MFLNMQVYPSYNHLLFNSFFYLIISQKATNANTLPSDPVSHLLPNGSVKEQLLAITGSFITHAEAWRMGQKCGGLVPHLLTRIKENKHTLA